MAMIPAMSAADFGTGGTAVMNYGMQVGKDLAAYGEKIGLQMKDNRDKQFAMSALPALQEAMKSFSAGQSGAGYSSIINLAAQDPSNPYVQNLAKLGMMGGQAIDENRYKTMRLAASGATLPAGPSGSDRLRAGQGGGGVPAVGNMNAEFVDDADYIDAQAMAEMPEFETPEQEEMYVQVRKFSAKPPREQQATLAQSTTTEKPNGYESRRIDGLSNLFPNLTGDLLIPEVGTITKIKRTVSTSDKPGSEIRESLSEVDEKVGEERYAFNIKAANNLPDAVNAMNKQAPIGEREPFVKLFNRNGGIANAVTAPTDDPKIYTLTFQGNDKDEYLISDTQASNLTVAQAIPAISGSGIKFLGSEKGATEAPAPTQAGIPANQLTTAAPEIPEEAMALQKIVEQGQAAKAGESAKNVENRIKDIDAQIKKLSAPIFQFGGTTSATGVKTREEKRSKTPEEAQADIQKIAQLKKQKRVLQGKYDTPAEVGEALQSGLLTRAKAEAILKNQFKM